MRYLLKIRPHVSCARGRGGLCTRSSTVFVCARREEWMDELCDNAVDPDWIENKQREEEERIQKGREHVMTGTYRLSSSPRGYVFN